MEAPSFRSNHGSQDQITLKLNYLNQTAEMVFTKEEVDYSLYLVTDSTMLPPGTTLCSQVEAGLKNGVTLVQIREKDIETKKFRCRGFRSSKNM